MDLVTHAIVGAACAHIILGNKDNRIPGIVGALAALAPDLDLLSQFISNNPLSVEYWHRNFTHALAFIPLGGFLVAFPFLLFPYFRKKWPITLAAAVIGVATHGILDACTSYGTLLFWPWSDRRVSWDLLAIIDPFFTIILCLGTAWSLIFHERKAASISLVLGMIYVFFCSMQHQRAIAQVHQFAKTQQMNITRLRAMPILGNANQWRVFAYQQQCLFIAEVSTPLMQQSQVKPIAQTKLYYSQNENHFLSEEQKNEIALFSWFTDDYLIIASTKPFILADGRYTWGNAMPITSLWSIELIPHQTYVKKTGVVLIKESCKDPCSEHPLLRCANTGYITEGPP